MIRNTYERWMLSSFQLNRPNKLEDWYHTVTTSVINVSELFLFAAVYSPFNQTILCRLISMLKKKINLKVCLQFEGFKEVIPRLSFYMRTNSGFTRIWKFEQLPFMAEWGVVRRWHLRFLSVSQWWTVWKNVICMSYNGISMEWNCQSASPFIWLKKKTLFPWWQQFHVIWTILTTKYAPTWSLALLLFKL